MIGCNERQIALIYMRYEQGRDKKVEIVMNNNQSKYKNCLRYLYKAVSNIN